MATTEIRTSEGTDTLLCMGCWEVTLHHVVWGTLHQVVSTTCTSCGR